VASGHLLPPAISDPSAEIALPHLSQNQRIFCQRQPGEESQVEDTACVRLQGKGEVARFSSGQITKINLQIHTALWSWRSPSLLRTRHRGQVHLWVWPLLGVCWALSLGYNTCSLITLGELWPSTLCRQGNLGLRNQRVMPKISWQLRSPSYKVKNHMCPDEGCILITLHTAEKVQQVPIHPCTLRKAL
jgi:hypothetical protein